MPPGRGPPKSLQNGRNSDPRRPSKSCSRLHGSTILTFAAGSPKVAKRTPKRLHFGTFWPQKSPRRPSGRVSKNAQKMTPKKLPKRLHFGDSFSDGNRSKIAPWRPSGHEHPKLSIWEQLSTFWLFFEPFSALFRTTCAKEFAKLYPVACSPDSVR